MKPLAYLIEKHDRHGLGGFADCEGGNRGNGHKKLLVEKFAAHDALGCSDEHGQTDHQIGDDEYRILKPGGIHDAIGVHRIQDEASTIDARSRHDEPKRDLPSAAIVVAMTMAVIMLVTVDFIICCRIAHDATPKTLKHSNELLIFKK